MSDLLEGTVTPEVANATTNAGGKLLKSVELQLKHGTPGPTGERELVLCPSVPPAAPPSHEERARMRQELLRQLASLEE